MNLPLLFLTAILLLHHPHPSSSLTLRPTKTPPLLSVPTYSLATIDPTSGSTGMNILTYATPVGIRPDRMWCISLYRGTLSHENFVRSGGKAVLQLLTERHLGLVGLLGGASGRDVDKRMMCEERGFPWGRGGVGGGWDDGPELLPGCRYYLRLTLVGDLIDCGDHEVAVCKVDEMAVTGGDDGVVSDDGDYLTTGILREKGIITEQGRVADDVKPIG